MERQRTGTPAALCSRVDAHGASVHDREAAVHDREAAVHDREASVHDREAAVHDREAAVHDREAAVHDREAAVHDREAADYGTPSLVNAPADVRSPPAPPAIDHPRRNVVHRVEVLARVAEQHIALRRAPATHEGHAALRGCTAAVAGVTRAWLQARRGKVDSGHTR